jgi:hypothetical protein
MIEPASRVRHRIGRAFAIAAFAAAAPAGAAMLTFNYNYEFSGAQAPGGAAPWMTATLDDGGGTGSVTLTISTGGLGGNENVRGAYFNLNPALDPASLAFAYVSGDVATSVQGSANAYKADGDGKYDILFEYPSGSGFDPGETSVYTISGIGSLTAASFNFFSNPAGGQGVYLAAAHVQDTTGAGTGGSGWIAPVPLPAAAWLLATGVAALAGVGWRGRRQHA